MIPRTSHLDFRLAAIHRRLIRRRAATALTEFILILLPLAILLGCLDYTLRPPAVGRLAELIVLLVALVAIVCRHLPALVRLTRRPEFAAALVERSDPSLAGRLLSYLDFRSERQTAGKASAELIAAMCSRIEQQTSGVVPEQVVPMRPVRACMLIAGALLGLACVGSALQPRIAQTWALRVSRPFNEIAWPPRTRIVSLETDPHLRRGDTLSITGRIAGRIPADCEIEALPSSELESKSDTRDRTIRVPIRRDGTFSATLGLITRPMTLRARAGDAKTLALSIDVIDPPHLADLAITCRYPDYLNRPDEGMASRDLRVPVGTRVDLTATSDKPAGTMMLMLMQDNVQTRRPFSRDSSTQGSTSFTVQAPGWYAIEIEDAAGVSMDDPPRYAIAAIENRYPSITLRYPETGMSVTPTARLPLEFEASDDFGVIAAAVVWGIRSSGSTEISPPSRTPIPLETQAPELSGRFMWNLAVVNPRPGDEIVFHLEARDAGEHIGPPSAGTAVSETRVLRVVDPATYRGEHLARLSASTGDINRLTVPVASAWDELSALARLLKLQQASCAAGLIERVRNEGERERSLAAQAEAIADRLDRLADEWQINMPDQAASPEGSRLLADAMTHLATGPMSDAPVALDAAIVECEADVRAALAQLVRARNAQAEALRTLARIASALVDPAAGQAGAQAGTPSTTPTEQDFDHAQKTLAANLRTSLESIPRSAAPPKSSTPSQTQAPRHQAGPVSSQRGQGAARNARETMIVGGPAQPSSIRPATTPEAIPSWQWNLPERDREVLRQATAEPFPPGQAAAIMRYYERLNRVLSE